MEQILDAIRKGEHKLADELLQHYIAGLSQYDDVTAILDAVIGSHYGDRMRVWEAIRKGLKYNYRNYELYVMLGEYYLQEDPTRAYLCYENALFYCDAPDDRTVIDGLLSQLQADHKGFASKTAIVIQPGASLEDMIRCVKSIRMTTSESTRKIVLVTDP